MWAYDFIHDACANGQKLKCLTVIDEFTRESLAIGVAGSIRSPRVIEVLSRLVSEHGAPTFLRSDNGPEFVSNAILAWLAEAKIDTAPKEIEERIDGLDGVCESAVIGVPHPDLGEAVTAVVVTHPGHAVCEHAIIAALEGEIARFKVPKRVGFVDELPRNAMGKVQKNVLRDRYRDVG